MPSPFLCHCCGASFSTPLLLRGHQCTDTAPCKTTDLVLSLKQQGNEAYKAGDLNKAMELFTRAIQLASPESSESFLPALYSNRSLVYCLMGRATGAVTPQQAERLPNSHDAHNSASRADCFDRAILDAREAARLLPNWQRPLLRLGEAQLGTQAYEEVTSAL